METTIKEEDLRNFEFLAINSKEIVEKQVDSYRQQQYRWLMRQHIAGKFRDGNGFILPAFHLSFDNSLIL